MSHEEDDSWGIYASDAVELLGDIEGSVLSLEAEPSQLHEVHRLYRALHTLKGNSALLGLTRIETLSHAAEDMVGLARDGGVAVDRPMVDLMLELIDRLKWVVTRAGRTRQDATPGEVEALIERVHGWTEAHSRGTPKAEVGATRGEILIWSDLPADGAAVRAASVLPASSELVGDDDSPEGSVAGASEFFLALCRELLPSIAAALRDSALDRSQHVLSPLLSQLSGAAVRLGYFDLVDCLGMLDEHYRHADQHAPSERAAGRAELARLLTELEQSERALHPSLPDFGIASLCGALTREDDAPTKRERASGPARAAARAKPATARPAAQAKPAASSGDQASADFLRIDARKLSHLMDLAGEIAIASGAVTQHADLAGLELEGFNAAAHKLEMLIRELQTDVSAMRLVPVSGVFQRMKRVVRDTSRRTGKNVELTLIGEETEIDKVMVDSLHDPLVHVVRNAIDHGIELPEERIAAGKAPVGRIVLEASHQGGEVSVKVRDDGRGLNHQRILQRARERGLLSDDAQLSEAQINDLVFLPGFSTKETIDELSGRGVGMDVIKTTIEGLRGRVQLESEAGRGSVLDMTVPLTLAFVEAMVVREGERLFALPIEKVIEVFKAERSQLARNSADGTTAVRVRDSLIPVLWLHRFYGVPRRDEQVEGRVVVVVQSSRGSLALPVDALLGNQLLMLKPLRGVLAGVRAAAGCGMLRSGAVALALDCEQLYESSAGHGSVRASVLPKAVHG